MGELTVRQPDGSERLPADGVALVYRVVGDALAWAGVVPFYTSQ